MLPDRLGSKQAERQNEMAKSATKPVSKAPAKSQALANKKQSQALATSDNALFAAHAGAGLENVTAKDILIPRLTIIQALSPQLIKSKPEYDADAKVGDIYDVGLMERLGDEIMFLPILFRKEWLEWYPRNTGKGLARIHPTDAILSHTEMDDRGRPVLQNGNYIAETSQFYGLNMTSENRLSFIPLASTQLKKGRQWLTMSTSEKVEGDNGVFVPPLFYRAYRLTTTPESNSEGDWMGWKIERGPALPEMDGWKDLYASLLETHRQISSGQARGDVAGMGEDAAGRSDAM